MSLSIYYLEYGCYLGMSSLSTSNTTRHDTHEKINLGLLFFHTVYEYGALRGGSIKIPQAKGKHCNKFISDPNFLPIQCRDSTSKKKVIHQLSDKEFSAIILTLCVSWPASQTLVPLPSCTKIQNLFWPLDCLHVWNGSWTLCKRRV